MRYHGPVDIPLTVRDVEETPDPLDTVTILRSDFEMLQKIADLAVGDAEALFDLLDLVRPDDMPHRQYFHEVALPVVAHLKAVNIDVEKAKMAIARSAERFDNKTIETHGVKGVKVGQRDPELAKLLSLRTPMTKAERRELKRRER